MKKQGTTSMKDVRRSQSAKVFKKWAARSVRPVAKKGKR